MKRKIEIFTAGCPICEKKVQEIKDAACENCEIEVLNINEDKEALKRSESYEIKSLPSVVIDGILAKCCSNSGIDMKVLKSMGLGVQS